MKCSSCGNRISPSDNYCQSCGSAIHSADEKEVFIKSPKKLPIWKIIFVTVLVFAIVSAGVFAWYRFVYHPNEIQASCQHKYPDYNKSLDGYMDYYSCLNNSGLYHSDLFESRMLLEIKNLKSQVEDTSRRSLQEPILPDSSYDYSDQLGRISQSLDDIKSEQEGLANCQLNGGRYVGGGLCMRN